MTWTLFIVFHIAGVTGTSPKVERIDGWKSEAACRAEAVKAKRADWASQVRVEGFCVQAPAN